MATSPSIPWPQRPLAPTDIPVGPCAWRLSMLAGGHADYVAAHPSLIVVDANDGDDLLRAAAPRLGSLPLMLNLREPPFARRLPEAIAARMGALGRQHVDVLTLWVEDVADLKGGVMLQMLRGLRDKGVITHIALGHADVRNAEWLALHTPARLLVLPWGIENQAAHYRAIGAAEEYGMARVAMGPPAGDNAVRFALGTAAMVLPVLDAPIPTGLTPMDDAEVAQAWGAYQAGHEAPAPLPRGQPPE